jgi:glutamate 5-kinase
VDSGARTAISEKNKSLLPGGIVAVKGDFSQGDVVEIACEDRNVIARGLSNYSAHEIR